MTNSRAVACSLHGTFEPPLARYRQQFAVAHFRYAAIAPSLCGATRRGEMTLARYDARPMTRVCYVARSALGCEGAPARDKWVSSKEMHGFRDAGGWGGEAK